MSIAPGISILMYHQVGKFPPMRAHRANYCDHRRFAAQMGLIARLGWPVLDLDTALACLRGERPLPRHALALTFDDGYEGFLEYALPVLQRYGFPATIYAISNWLGRRAEWFAKDPGRPIPRLLSGSQLRDLREAGIAIGSHTANHAKLAELDPHAQRRELSQSKAALEEILGAPVDHLGYPFGSFNLDTLRAAAESGYRSATTCLRGRAEPADHALALPRKAISFGDNLIGLAWKVLAKNRPKPALVEWRARLGKHQDCNPRVYDIGPNAR